MTAVAPPLVLLSRWLSQSQSSSLALVVPPSLSLPPSLLLALSLSLSPSLSYSLLLLLFISNALRHSASTVRSCPIGASSIPDSPDASDVDYHDDVGRVWPPR